jgi:GTP-binding protein
MKAAGPVVLDARFVGAADQLADLPPSVHTELAFGGRSNVGKSSLMNMLLGRRKLVRTSSTPGATRTINVFEASLDGGGGRRVLGLVDLPGYGFAHRSKSERASWGPMIEQYLAHRPGLRRVVVVCDARRGIGEEDGELLEYLAHLGKPSAIAMTKVDKLSRSERQQAERTWAGTPEVPLVWASAETGEGRAALWAALLA